MSALVASHLNSYCNFLSLVGHGKVDTAKHYLLLFCCTENISYCTPANEN